MTLEEHRAALQAWRNVPHEEQLAIMATRAGAAQPADRAATLARVNSCPDRGGVLPISMQDPGCGCGELSECFAGKGKTPGKVGLRDCLACKA